MAGTEVNLYSVGDVDLTAMMDTLDRQRITFHALSLTNYDNTSLPAIAAGSHEEVAGTLFKFTVEEAITGWGAIANDTAAYIKLVPAGTDPDTVTAEFTDTAPTWSDAKQGWYGTAAAANHRYIGGLHRVDAATYSQKWLYGTFDTSIQTIKVYGDGTIGDLDISGSLILSGASRARVTKNNAQSINNASSTIVQYDDEDYDNLGEFASYRFTAKEAGYYFVTASLLSANVLWAGGEYWQITLFKDGAAISSGFKNIASAGETRTFQSIVSDVVYLAATNFIDIRVYQNSGIAINTDTSATHNYFSVHRLS